MSRKTTDADYLGGHAVSPYRLAAKPLATVAGRSTLRGSWRKATGTDGKETSVEPARP